MCIYSSLSVCLSVLTYVCIQKGLLAHHIFPHFNVGPKKARISTRHLSGYILDAVSFFITTTGGLLKSNARAEELFESTAMCS